MSKHTPGPWRMEADGRIWTHSRVTCQTLGYFKGVASNQNHIDEHLPNCRLIAASPMLFKVFKAVYEFIEMHGDDMVFELRPQEADELFELENIMKETIKSVEDPS